MIKKAAQLFVKSSQPLGLGLGAPGCSTSGLLQSRSGVGRVSGFSDDVKAMSCLFALEFALEERQCFAVI